MDWTRDLPTWPMSHLSRRIRHGPHLWHVQEDGTERGETVLMLHGAGASTHSWRALLPRLAEARHVVALDLPGQGFSRAGDRPRLGLEPMAHDIAALAQAQGWRPTLILGHSAGAALALSLADTLRTPAGAPPRICGINAALAGFKGVAGWLFPVLARLLAANPFTANLFTLGPGGVARARRLIEGTGSHLDAEGLRLYARLIDNRDHVDGTLRMMSQWDVAPLLTRLAGITAPCLLITGDNDHAVPPDTSDRAARILPCAVVRHLAGLGHLAHEEAPERVLAVLSDPANWPRHGSGRDPRA